MIEDLLPIGLLIVVAKLPECLLDRIGLSSIVAYTAAGILLGPVAGIVEPTNKLQVFLGIGVFILFFLVGLDEIDIPGFVATLRGRFFCAAILSVVISMVAAMMVTSDLFGVGFALDLHFKDALALAGLLSMSSLGLVAKVLADKGYLKEPLGLEIFYHGHHCGDDHATGCGIQHRRTHHLRGAFSVVFLLAEVAAFAVVAWILSARVMPPTILFLKRIFNVPELSFGLLIGGLFLSYPAASLSIRNFADNWIVPDQQDYVVVNDGAVAGIVSPARLTSVPMVA